VAGFGNHCKNHSGHPGPDLVIPEKATDDSVGGAVPAVISDRSQIIVHQPFAGIESADEYLK
jgi:hypothetical protein